MQQAQLFKFREQAEAPGLTLRPDYLWPREEQEFLRHVDQEPWWS